MSTDHPSVRILPRMQAALVARTLGIFLVLFSAALLPPLAVSLLYGDGEADHVALSLGVSLASGLLLWLPTLRPRQAMRHHDGFVIVAMLWIAMSLLGSLPFVIGLGLSPADAVFESVSAFTTTGATVIVGLDALPPSILFFRQEMQWLGGIGFVVSAIALLPILGVGGMQLLKAETPGPMKDDKLTPRIAHTARALWILYLSITGVCALLYWIAGMTPFDAIAHSLTTVSTGGFSTHDASLAYFDSLFIEGIATVFMLVGGISFSVHYLVWQRVSLRPYWDSPEVRVFLAVVLGVVLIATLVLYLEGAKASPGEALRYSAFTVASVITSTGFTIDDFSVWPTLLPMLLIFVSFIGGCAGSTAGGIKVIRFVVLGKQIGIELRRLVHPSHVQPLLVGRQVIKDRTLEAVWAFFGLYVGAFVVLMLALMTLGMDAITAFGAVATCMNNLGPGLSETAANFAAISDAEKWICALAMLLGRLEIFTLLVLFTPGFWRD